LSLVEVTKTIGCGTNLRQQSLKLALALSEDNGSNDRAKASAAVDVERIRTSIPAASRHAAIGTTPDRLIAMTGVIEVSDVEDLASCASTESFGKKLRCSAGDATLRLLAGKNNLVVGIEEGDGCLRASLVTTDGGAKPKQIFKANAGVCCSTGNLLCATSQHFIHEVDVARYRRATRHKRLSPVLR
jgi:hypothetical protein